MAQTTIDEIIQEVIDKLTHGKKASWLKSRDQKYGYLVAVPCGGRGVRGLKPLLFREK